MLLVVLRPSSLSGVAPLQEPYGVPTLGSPCTGARGSPLVLTGPFSGGNPFKRVVCGGEFVNLGGTTEAVSGKEWYAVGFQRGAKYPANCTLLADDDDLESVIGPEVTPV